MARSRKVVPAAVAPAPQPDPAATAAFVASAARGVSRVQLTFGR